MSEETTAATTEAPKTKAPVEKVQLTIKGVIADLENGLDRKAIAKKYGLNKANATKLFADPKLQHRKVVRPVEEQFVLIDDAPDLKPIIVNKKPVAPKVDATISAEGAALAASNEGETVAATETVQNGAVSAQQTQEADAKGEW